MKARKISGIILGLFFIIISLPLTLKIVPPNPFYGVRTSSTFNNLEAWYTVNFYAGLAFLILGVFYTFMYSFLKKELITNKMFLITSIIPALVAILLVIYAAI